MDTFLVPVCDETPPLYFKCSRAPCATFLSSLRAPSMALDPQPKLRIHLLQIPVSSLALSDSDGSGVRVDLGWERYACGDKRKELSLKGGSLRSEDEKGSKRSIC